MAKKTTCLICGTEFETNRPNKKYCSFSCREAGRILRRMNWEAENPGYSKNYMKKYREVRKHEGAN